MKAPPHQPLDLERVCGAPGPFPRERDGRTRSALNRWSPDGEESCSPFINKSGKIAVLAAEAVVAAVATGRILSRAFAPPTDKMSFPVALKLGRQSGGLWGGGGGFFNVAALCSTRGASPLVLVVSRLQRTFSSMHSTDGKQMDGINKDLTGRRSLNFSAY